MSGNDKNTLLRDQDHANTSTNQQLVHNQADYDPLTITDTEPNVHTSQRDLQIITSLDPTRNSMVRQNFKRTTIMEDRNQKYSPIRNINQTVSDFSTSHYSGNMMEFEGSPRSENQNLNKQMGLQSPQSIHSFSSKMTEEELKNQKSYCSAFRTVCVYLISSLTKKRFSFQIGIFTVFLVVAVITMLKSVVDISPILFVKMGQDQAGAIDIRITAPTQSQAMFPGNKNFYDINPFNGYTVQNGLISNEAPKNGTCENPVLEYLDALCYDDHISLMGLSIVNVDWFTSRLEQLNNEFDGFTPRWTLPKSVLRNPQNNSMNVTSVLLIIDSLKEIQIGLGLYFPPIVLGQKEALINSQVMSYLSLDIGETVQVHQDVGNYLKVKKLLSNLARKQPWVDIDEVSINYDEHEVYLADMIDAIPLPDEFVFDYKISGTFDKSDGKFPSTYGNVMIIDCHYILDEIFDQMSAQSLAYNITDPELYDEIQAFLDKARAYTFETGSSFCNYTMELDGVLRDQASYYTQSYEKIKEVIQEVGANVVDAITLQANATITAPLESEFGTTSLIKIFLNATLMTVLFFLGILSAQLIVSLMLSDVDQKTYEYGMLRALGFQNNYLIGLISLQSLLFAIPGVLGGLVTAGLITVFLKVVIFQVSQNADNYQMSKTALILGCCFGILMPLLANIIPIKNALGKNLRNSLDLDHRGTNSLTVKVAKLEEFSMSLSQIGVGLLLVFCGILTYYAVPLSYLYNKLGYFFFIFQFLLILVVLGLTFLSVLLFKPLEYIVMNIIMLTCCRRDRKIKPILAKNLHAHRKRNNKTSIMFTLALSFLIFSASSFKLINNMIIDSVESLIGADLYANTLFGDSYLNEGPITEFLVQQEEYDGAVEDFTFVSANTNRVFGSLRDRYYQYVSDVSRYNTKKVDVYGVSENYLNVVDVAFYEPQSMQAGLDNLGTVGGKVDSISALYSNQSYNTFNYTSKDYYNVSVDVPYELDDFTEEIKILLPSGLKNPMSFSSGYTGKLCDLSGCEVTYSMKIRGLLTKIPGFIYSSYPQIEGSISGLVSNNQYVDILNDFFEKYPDSYTTWQDNVLSQYNFTDNIPKQMMFVKLSPNISEERRTFISNGLRSFFSDDATFLIDKTEIVDSLNSTELAFTIFVAIIGFIALLLSFFLLLVSMSQNVKDTVWEYGVLRAIGITKAQGQRVYMYEAFVIMISATILGLTVGMIVAWTVTAQIYLFLELPYIIEFPTYLVTSMLLVAFITTYYAVYVPISSVNKKKISTVLKSGS